METVYVDDRKKVEREEREEARRIAEALEAEDDELFTGSDADEVEDLLVLFKQQDRRRS
jgi:hypothetical protein